MQIRDLMSLLIQQDPNDAIVIDTAEGTVGIERLMLSQSHRDTVRLIPTAALLTETEAEAAFTHNADIPIEADTTESLKTAVLDFLVAVDRGDYGNALIVGPPTDRAESAFVAALRKEVSPC